MADKNTDVTITETRLGRMRVFPPTDLISKSLIEYGEWAWAEVEFLTQFIEKGDVAIDIGANIGFFTKAFSKSVGRNGKVYAFEPVSEIYDLLSRNCNGKNVENIQFGIHSSVGRFNVIDNQYNKGGSKLEYSKNSRRGIEVRPLDSFDFDSKIRLIKMDIEGNELNALKGAGKTLETHRPFLFLEVNDAESAQRIIEFLQDRNYRSFGFFSRAFNRANFKGSELNIFGLAGECALFAVPNETEMSVLGAAISDLRSLNTVDDVLKFLMQKKQYLEEIDIQLLSEMEQRVDQLLQRNRELALNVEEQRGQTSTFERSLASAYEQIRALDSNLLQHQEQINALSGVVAQRDERIDALSAVVTQRDERIDALSAVVTQRDEQIDGLSTVVTQRDEHINALNRAATEKDAYADTLRRKIDELAQNVRESSYQISILEKSSAWHEQKSSELHHIAVARQTRIDELEHAVHLYSEHVASLERTLSERDQHLNSVLSSVSWRATRPVRAFASLGKRLTGRAEEPAFRPTVTVLVLDRDSNIQSASLEAVIKDLKQVKGSKIVVVADAASAANVTKERSALGRRNQKYLEIVEVPEQAQFSDTLGAILEQNAGADVVLSSRLPAQLPENWLARLRLEAYSEDEIATVSPFTNCGDYNDAYGLFRDHDEFSRTWRSEIDAEFDAHKLPLIDNAVFGASFTFIRAEAIERIGLGQTREFSVGQALVQFGKRVLASGWKNALSPNIYFHHEPEQRAQEPPSLLPKAARTEPAGGQQSGDGDADDGLDDRFAARVFRQLNFICSKDVGRIVHITHGLGGGVETHLKELCSHLDHQGVFSLVLRPKLDGAFELSLGAGEECDTLRFAGNDAIERLESVLARIRPSMIHLHHFLNLSDEFLAAIKNIDAPKAYTFHDYYPICGNPTLTNQQGLYTTDTAEWFKNPHFKSPAPDQLEEFQAPYRAMFSECEMVIFPSVSTFNIVKDWFDFDRFVVTPHLEKRRSAGTRTLRDASDLNKVGVIGAIGLEKGADRLRGLSTIASRNGEIEFTLIGFASLKLPHVTITGEYGENDDIVSMIEQFDLGTLLFTAKCPETYSYTLSIALQTDLPIIAPSVGAFPERLSGRPDTLLYAHDADDEDLYEMMVNFLGDIRQENHVLAPEFQSSVDVNAEFYDRGYLELLRKNAEGVKSDLPEISGLLSHSK